jgi:hypothetical protein
MKPMKSIVTKENKLFLGYNTNGKYRIQIENIEYK